ncbi:hypothetical protein [Microcoleus sp. herbarium14]|uniref:hypothetical protein n=1 Tax=Microcoleus sp. herbarium14 TaxID=3055439 RepID=UPI002FD13ACF
MAVITPGTGSTINATTIEGQLWQLIHLYQNAERSSAESVSRFESTKDDTFVMKGSFSIPGSLVYASATGVFTDVAIPYLPATTFTAGSPLGTIKSTTLSQYFLDCIMYVIVWQNNGAKNTQALTNITCKFDLNTRVYTGTFSLPYVTTISTNGAITETATEWLLT